MGRLARGAGPFIHLGARGSLLLLLAVTTGAGCARSGFVPTPCDGHRCSGHGLCVATAQGEAFCACDPGYHNDGDLACVADPGAAHDAATASDASGRDAPAQDARSPQDAASHDAHCGTPEELCAQAGVVCDDVRLLDHCGAQRDLRCTCRAPERCGAEGDPSQCGMTFCSPTGWCWDEPQPHGYTLNAVWGFAADDVWTGGPKGLLAHWDGVTWRRHHGVTGEDIHTLWGSGPGDLWAGGARGTLLHWDGSAWGATAGVTGDIEDIWGTSRDDAWLIANTTDLWRLTGGGWARSASSGAGALHAVWGAAPDDYWAAGANGALLRWNGSAWLESPTGAPSATYTAIHGCAADDVWLAGTGSVVKHWNGSIWEDRSLTGMSTPMALWCAGGDLWYSACCGSVRRWRGSWEYVLVPWACSSACNYYTDLWGSAPDHVIGTTTFGGIARWDGTSWARGPGATSLAGGNALLALWTSPAGTGWAVGRRSVILKGSSGSWQVEMAPGGMEGLRAVWGSSDTDVWAVGDRGHAVHCDGQCAKVESGVTADLNGVWGDATGHFIAVGAEGLILRWDGAGWAQASSPVQADLFAVWGRSLSDIWVVGASGTALHHDGQDWQTTDPGAYSGRFRAVWGVPEGDVWAAQDFRILRWSSASGWQPAGGAGFRSLSGTSASDIWAAGDVGRLAHWDGSAWSSVDHGLGRVNFSGVWATEPGAVCLVAALSSPGIIACLRPQ